MSKQYGTDAAPNNNQCILVESFIVCLTWDALDPNEIRTTYHALLPHLDSCLACTKSLERANVQIPGPGGGETHLLTEREIDALVKTNVRNHA
jgi:hypothetical protein